MSDLSTFLVKPYPGLSKSSDNVLVFSRTLAELQILATDAAVTGINSPVLRMRGAYQAVGSGPQIIMEALNASAAAKNAAVFKASLTTLTAGAENSTLSLSVLAAGTAVSMQFLGGAIPALIAGADGQVLLGGVGGRFAGLYIGNATPISGQFVPNGSDLTLDLAGSTAHALRLRPNGVTAAIFDPTTATAIGGAAASRPYQLYVAAGAAGHPTNTTSAYGVGVGGTFPAAATALHAGFHALVTTATAAYTVAEVSGLLVSNATKGVGSTISNQMGLHVGKLTVGTYNFGAYLELDVTSTNWNVYAIGSASNYLAGATYIGGSAPADASVTSPYLTVTAAGLGQQVAKFYTTGGTSAGTILTLQSSSTTGLATLLSGLNDAGTQKFTLLANGSAYFSTTSAYNTGLVSINGRTTVAINQTHDLFASVVAATLCIGDGSTAITVADTKQSELISMRTSATIAGTGILDGYYAYLNVTSSGASSTANGSLVQIQIAGSGTARSLYGIAQAAAGHTGGLTGVTAQVLAQATSGQVAMFQGIYSGLTDFGLYLSCSNPGDQLNYGIYIGSDTNVATAAVYQQQRAGSVGAFLQLYDSSAVQRFQVAYTGDVTIGGVGRRIYGDFTTSATPNDRLSFITSVADSTTIIQAFPSGTGTTAGWASYNASSATNSMRLLSYVTSAAAFLWGSELGSGTLLPLKLAIGASQLVGLTLQTNNDITLGAHSGMVTSSSAGFPYIPQIAGAPSGSPTARTGFSALIHDTTNARIYVHNGTSWKYAALV